MGTTKLKSSLHKLIDKVEDNTILNAVYSILNEVVSSRSTTTLTPLEKKAVDDALKSVKRGDTFANKDVMAEMKRKYPKLVR